MINRGMMWFGVVSGVVFVFTADHFGLWSLGVFLTAFSVLGIADQRGTVAGIRSFVELQHNRMSALLRLYRMAPMVVANQERMQRIAKRLELVEGRTEMWLQIAQSSTSMQKVINGVQWYSHRADHNAHFASEIERSDLLSELQNAQQGEAALVVTDIGEGVLDAKSLSCYLNGEVEIDFWIGRGVVRGHDLMVVPRQVFTTSPRLIEAVVAKLSTRYNRIAIFAHEETRSFWNGDHTAVRGVGDVDEVHITRNARRVIEAP